MALKNIINTGTKELIQNMALCDVQVVVIGSIVPTTIKLANDKVLPLDFFMFSKGLQYLRTTEDRENIGKKLIAIKQTGGQKYFVLAELEDLE